MAFWIWNIREAAETSADNGDSRDLIQQGWIQRRHGAEGAETVEIQYNGYGGLQRR